MTIATDQGDWVKQHLGTIEHSYGKAPHAGEVLPLLKDLYAQAGTATHLSHVNRGLLEGLGIPTRITWSTDYVALEGSDAFSPTDRLVTLCVRAGATTYLSGPAAQDEPITRHQAPSTKEPRIYGAKASSTFPGTPPLRG